MLPMILGFLGSAFAPSLAAATGIGALASPLLAGAIGSGVGRAVETGDIGAGLRTGIGSFIGGKILGSAMNGSGAGTEGGLLGGFTGGPPAAPGMTTGTPLAVPAEGIGALMPPTGAPAASGGLFQSGALGSGMRRGMDFMSSAEGIGSQLGGSLLGGAMSRPKPTVSLPAQTTAEGPAEMPGIPRQQNIAPTGYRPGVDPEFNYGVSTPYSYEDIIGYRDTGVLPYAEGGEVKAPNEKTEIVDAIKAIKGQHEQPEIALGKFLAKYGEEALRNLVDSVESGELDETVERFASGERGMVEGPGDDSGEDDKVPATIDGEQDLLLTDGEFVMRKSATDALEKKFGGGFLSAINKAGDGAPEVLAKRMAA